MKISLRTRLTISFSLLIIVPLSILGIVSYNLSSNSLQKSVLEELKTTTARVSESVKSKTKNARKYLEIASNNSELAKAVQGNKKVKKAAMKYMKKLFKQTDGAFEWIYITDASGKDIVDNNTIKPDKDLSNRSYVQKALAGSFGESSEVLTSKQTGRPIIGAAYPLKIDGKVVGVIGGTMLFKEIVKDAAEVKVEKTGHAFLIDKKGLLIYHPDKKKNMKENLSKSSNKELRELVNKMKQGEKGEGYYTYNGEYKYLRYEPVGSWSLAVTVPYHEYMAPAMDIRNDTILLVAIFILLGAAVSAYTTYRVVRPIKRLEKLMRKAGEGDLTVESSISTGDEIEELGKSFNSMIKHQSNIVGKVRGGSVELASGAEGMATSSEQINAAVEEISASMEEVAANSEEQNKSVVEVSQVLVQLSSLVQLAQNKALAANKNSSHTMNAAQDGREKVNQTVDAIGIIEDSTNEADKVMEVLDGLSKKVGGIIETINSIAEQTNLLALNAAIEAARAGEYGKGFTVVSDQIRKLSEQSNSGANQVGALVNEMVLQIEKAVTSMANAKKAVGNGVSVAKATDESFVSIISAVQEIVDNIQDIVDVTKDEVATSDQIIHLIDSVASRVEANSEMSVQVASAVQEQASSVEVLASTAEETSAMATSLENLVEKFKIKE